jgi:hypothetical protein
MKIYTKIKMIDIKKIKPYFNNPRENDKTVQALMKSISVLGFNVPIVIDKNFTIIKGHSRYCAAVELGLEKLPCIISEATDKENQADRLYDNAIQELSKWDYDKLGLELRELDFKIEDVKFFTDELNYNYGEVTQEQLDGANKIFGVNDKSANHLKFICPKCGEEVYFSKNEIDKNQ